MRRLAFAILMLAALAPVACKRERKTVRAVPADDEAQLVSIVNVADPRSAVQLVKGFHNLEDNAWRWTMSKFSVALRPPGGSAQTGARLELKFVIPDPIQKLLPISVTATVNGMALPPETYSETGSFTYARDVPASALAGDAVTVDFATNKSIPAGPQDARELALVVTSIGLVPRSAQ